MNLRLLIFLALAAWAFGETPSQWPCQADIHKAEPNVMFARVSDGVTNKMADKKALPDIADLKGKKADSIVVVEILAGTEGNVRCARIQQGDPDLAERSLEAAQKWHYKPYLLNGQKIIVDTWIRFNYTNDNVEIMLPIK